MDEPNKDVTVLKPKTHKEHYLAKIAGEDVTIPEPKTPQEYFLKKIAENGGGSGGASSLADLSDVEITDNIDNGYLLAYSNGIWQSVRRDKMLLNEYVDLAGAVAVGDVGEFRYFPRIAFRSDTTFGQSFDQVISAAIQAGHFSANLDNASLRGLVLNARDRIIYNVSMYLVLYVPDGGIKYTLVLSGASDDAAVFSGIVGQLDGAVAKHYRITMLACAPNGALTATLAVKAEELTGLEISLD